MPCNPGIDMLSTSSIDGSSPRVSQSIPLCNKTRPDSYTSETTTPVEPPLPTVSAVIGHPDTYTLSPDFVITDVPVSHGRLSRPVCLQVLDYERVLVEHQVSCAFRPMPPIIFIDSCCSAVTAAPDGYPRQMYAVNNLFPGPMIEANEGDEIIVHIDNYLHIGMTIHWHGMFQNGSQWMDGVAGVSQVGFLDPPGNGQADSGVVPDTSRRKLHLPIQGGRTVRVVLVALSLCQYPCRRDHGRVSQRSTRGDCD